MPARVVVPYVGILHPIVKRVIEHCAYKPEFIEMRDDDNYWRLFCELWENRRTVLIIERDILPWPGACQEIINCPYHWCSNTYKMRGGYGIHHGFGFTKFGSKFMDKYPDIWTQVETTKWNTLDAQLCELVKREGETPHPHRPSVTHLKGLV